jgi:hypothetical protein
MLVPTPKNINHFFHFVKNGVWRAIGVEQGRKRCVRWQTNGRGRGTDFMISVKRPHTTQQQQQQQQITINNNIKTEHFNIDTSRQALTLHTKQQPATALWNSKTLQQQQQQNITIILKQHKHGHIELTILTVSNSPSQQPQRNNNYYYYYYYYFYHHK